MKNEVRKSFLSGNCCTFVAFLTLCGFMLLIVHCDVGFHSPDDNGIDLKKLLEASRSTEAASSIDLSQYKHLDPKKVPKGSAPLFPIYSFLLGEIYRLRGENTQAKRMYQGLVEWAAADPYGDGWGGSGLVSLALRRWLQITNTDSNLSPNEGDRLLKIFLKIWNTRLVRGMFQTFDIFGSLPQLQEDILRRLISLAWSIGKKEDAQRLFIEYLSVARTTDLSHVETTLLNESVSSGVLSLGHVALFRGKRLEFFGNYDGASYWLNKALESESEQIKAEASFYIARMRRKLGEKCANPRVLNLLATAINNASNPNVVQEALLSRAMLSIREGCPKNDHQFKMDLNRLIADFPQGQLADDALFQLASYFLDLYWDNGNNSDLEEALRLFGQLRNFKGPNDFLDSSRLKPALGLYSRGKPEDIQEASSLLQELEKERPFGPLHLSALFWLGRMAAESGDEEGSKSYFKKIIEESPYDYYAIRARMHLNLGNRASKELHVDQRTRDELRKAFRESKNAISLSGTSPYHIRLRKVLESGIYSTVIEEYSSVRKEFPSQRLEDISLEKLDGKNLLIYVGILLASRQDALSAADLQPDPVNRLEIAGAVGHFTKDWPLVIYITGAWDKPYEIGAATQRDNRYLATAYPMVFGQWIKKFGAEYKLPVGLIYGVIRIESAFYPEALSTEGALGLFQFIPKTFEALNKRWNLLKIKKKSSREDFLLDPELNIYLGARWFKEELLTRQKGDIVLALLEHISGAPAVKEWRAMWTRTGRANDYEYMLETVRYQSVRPFMRIVLVSLWIVEAVEIYQAN